MIKVIKKKYIYIILLVIIVLGFFLRKHDLNTWPRLGATFDEYAWTWQGMNLIEKGVPISWSPHPQYKNAKEIIYQKTHFRLVTPYLEHPPLFGLVAGGFAILRGAQDMYHLELRYIRPLALLLGTISIFLVYLLASEIYDKRVGILSSVLYAVVPTVAVGSRIVQNENFFIPLWLCSLFLITKFIKTKNPTYRNIAAVICGLLILAKIPWIAAAGSIILILMYLKKYKDAGMFAAIVIPIALIYLVYGIYFDSKLFFSLWGLQLNRYDISFTSIFALFQKPYLVDRFLTDGWIYFGWFAYVLLLAKDFKKNFIIILALLSYFVIFLAGIPDEPGHGWYRYPFYPFLIISIALFIKEYFNKNYLLTFFFLVLVGAPLLQLTWVPVFGFSYFIFRLAIIGWSTSLLPVFIPNKSLARFSHVASYIWFGLFIILSIFATLQYNEQ